MSLSVLRRFARTEPVATLFWDVAAEVSATPQPAPALPPAAPARSPSYTPGLCWHKAHVCLDGERYGVTPLAGPAPYERAALTRCEHLSRTGR
jgi:hypothetical protein